MYLLEMGSDHFFDTICTLIQNDRHSKYHLIFSHGKEDLKASFPDFGPKNIL